VFEPPPFGPPQPMTPPPERHVDQPHGEDSASSWIWFDELAPIV
jgi:hypothetical protein